MLKLQRLQQKAILDDDYDAGELPHPRVGHCCSAGEILFHLCGMKLQ